MLDELRNCRPMTDLLSRLTEKARHAPTIRVMSRPNPRRRRQPQHGAMDPRFRLFAGLATVACSVFADLLAEWVKRLVGW